MKQSNGIADGDAVRSVADDPESELPPRVLVVAGSDPSGGAGLQADLRVLQAFGAYPTSAVTALTVQDTRGVHAVSNVDPLLVERQMRVVLDDVGADCIKLGMLGTRMTVELVARTCEERARSVPIVLDPVLTSSSGLPLLELGGHATLVERLLPQCALVTPNAPEAELLTGVKVGSEADQHRAADALLMMGPPAVLVTGGHLPGDTVVDLLRTVDGLERRFESPRLPGAHHGTGCTLSSAIAAGLARGQTLESSVDRALSFVGRALRNALAVGGGALSPWFEGGDA